MDGLERIRVLASEIKSKATLKVIDYLLSREDMNEKYLNEKKSLTEMIDYIRSEAKKQSEDGVAMIENEEVYGWAIHYWDEENLKVEDTKDYSKRPTKKEEVKTEKPVKKEWVPEGQLTLFD